MKTARKETPKREPQSQKSIVFGDHESLVQEFAKRWNYALPPYPPKDYSYKAILKEKKLHAVSIVDFNKLKTFGGQEERKVDSKKQTDKIPEGFTLVHEVDHYPGVFRSAKGELHDLRPNSAEIIRPSLKTFSEMPAARLRALLIKAYTA